jgi:hypothetical protein
LLISLRRIIPLCTRTLKAEPDQKEPEGLLADYYLAFLKGRSEFGIDRKVQGILHSYWKQGPDNVYALRK